MLSLVGYMLLSAGAFIIGIIAFAFYLLFENDEAVASPRLTVPEIIGLIGAISVGFSLITFTVSLIMLGIRLIQGV